MKQFIYKCACCLILAAMLLGTGPDTAYAKNASGAAAFDNLHWEKFWKNQLQQRMVLYSPSAQRKIISSVWKTQVIHARIMILPMPITEIHGMRTGIP